MDDMDNDNMDERMRWAGWNDDIDERMRELGWNDG